MRSRPIYATVKAMTENYAPDTFVVSGGRPAHEHDAPVNPPVVFSSTFRGAGSVDISTDKVYARFANPSWDGMEEIVAQLEGASQPGLLFPSGMAAVASVIDLVPAGAIILIPKHAYMASVTMAKDLERRGIATVVRLDIEDTDSCIRAFEQAAATAGVTAETVNYAAPKVLAWLESPTNPMLEVADLPALCEAARRLGIVTAVDNTFATPLLQQPLSLGADVVVHSATKYLSGHSDVLLGITATNHEELYQAMRHHRITNGAIPGPMEAWLGLRGLRTLSLRVERAVANAQELAERFEKHPMVREVRYPGLPSDKGHELAKKQLTGGFGAVLCIVLDADAEQTERVVEQLQLWTPATSLGGVESLVERRRRHGSEPESIPVSLLRLAVGIENVEDLYADFERALAILGD